MSRAHFTLSAPSSAHSSRSSSPVSYHDEQPYAATKPSSLRVEISLDEDDDEDMTGDVYDATLPAWRAAIRRRLVKIVERETRVLARMQDYVRRPFLDAYFVYTSSLGTHSFFMTVLPSLFFFGYGEIGRGLLLVLVFGVYLASFIKDLLCSPRPFAPPVTRLTIGNHHLEYGFPSTHSTNSVSLALFFYSHVHRLATISASADSLPVISSTTYYILSAILFFYMFSIVYGRLYTAMHSFTDCTAGVILGASIWYFFDNWLGFGAHAFVERWVIQGGWQVPVIVTTLCLFLVHKHPQPVDDCPCFEDAIAFNSVMMGSLVARWVSIYVGLSDRHSFMPGGAWSTWEDKTLWWGVASAKMVFGIFVIFGWRIIAKPFFRLVLPPFFRFLSFSGFDLPHRRFYTPATDYKSVPSEALNGLRAVPSLIDLPSSVEMQFDEDDSRAEVSGVREPSKQGSEIKLRGSNPNGTNGVCEEKSELLEEEDGGSGDSRTFTKKHYDADVLTKVFVYCGIGILACEAMPAFFNAAGWGVNP